MNIQSLVSSTVLSYSRKKLCYIYVFFHFAMLHPHFKNDIPLSLEFRGKEQNTKKGLSIIYSPIDKEYFY